MKPKTYFIDIDGTILWLMPDFQETIKSEYIKPLPQAVQKISKWHCRGHKIVLVTARPESLRSVTEQQLYNAGIVYDHLLMGLTGGVRVLVNDYEPGEQTRAVAFNVIRNEDGLKKVD